MIFLFENMRSNTQEMKVNQRGGKQLLEMNYRIGKYIEGNFQKVKQENTWKLRDIVKLEGQNPRNKSSKK